MAETRNECVATRRAVAKGTPLLAEEDSERQEGCTERVKLPEAGPGAEAIQGDTIDYVDAVFLRTGSKATRALARVPVDDGQAS